MLPAMKAPAFVAIIAVLLAAARAADETQPGQLKDLDGYFPFKVPATEAEWQTRAEELRRRILVSQGLFPLPTKTPLNAVIHGRIEQDDYTVEKVFFEAMPGFYVTGNLYRPRGKSGPHPAVLCAHGHWEDARFAIRGDAEMKKELETGGEQLAESGRSMFQSLCVGLARMGCVAFMYDMLGNSDSQQISMALAHKFAKQRAEASAPDGWGFFSAQAELRLQSVMGLQTWSSIRAIDFVTSLPDVDAKRIGMTGASGGGTQTFIAAAIDPRITVAVPCVMVSTAMQGGCTCENASLLRVGTGNVEIAALFAPKPIGMTSANDWTREMETKGFPELKALYKLMGAEDNVALWPQLQFGHNYNSPTREHIYSWFNKHFALQLPEPIVERDYKLLPREQLTVWDAAHPAPEGGLEFEKKLLRWWDADSTKTLADHPEMLGQAWRTLVRPVTQIPVKSERDGPIVVWVDDHGPLAADDPIREMHAQFIAPEFGANLTQQPVVKNPREALAYTLGYNDSLFAQRVQDVLAIVAGQRKGSPIVLVGNGKTGPIAAAAAALAGDAVSGVVIPSAQHPFANITDWRDPSLLPGAVKYGDLEGLVRLNAPRPVLVFNNDAERKAALAKLLSGAR